MNEYCLGGLVFWWYEENALLLITKFSVGFTMALHYVLVVSRRKVKRKQNFFNLKNPHMPEAGHEQYLKRERKYDIHMEVRDK